MLGKLKKRGKLHQMEIVNMDKVMMLPTLSKQNDQVLDFWYLCM